MKLKKLGKGYPTKSGNIVVPVKELPKIGQNVVTRNMLNVGFVYDIIGPVKSPFVVIRPVNKNIIEKVIFDEFYVVMDYGGDRKGKGSRKERKGKGNRKKRNRKRRYA